MNAHKTFAGASSHDQKHVVSGEDLQAREHEELRNAAWMRGMRGGMYAVDRFELAGSEI